MKLPLGRCALAVMLLLSSVPAYAQEAATTQAEVAYTVGDYATALADYEAIVRNFPGDPIAWLKIARIHAKLGEWQEAATAFGRLAELGPLDTAVRVEYGDALKAAGDLAGAVEQYSLALHGDAGGAPAATAPKPPASSPTRPAVKKAPPSGADTAHAKVPQPRAEQAEYEATKPVAAPADEPADVPSFRDVKDDTAEGAGQAGRGGLGAAEEIVPVSPSVVSDAGAGFARGGEFYIERESRAIEVGKPVLLQAGTGDAAKGEAAAGGESQPQPTDWLATARDDVKKKKWADAVAAYEQLISAGPVDVAVRLEYADALRNAGMLDKARDEFNRVLHLDSENVRAKVGLAKVLAQSGQIEEAMYLLDQVSGDAASVRMAREARVYAYYVNGYLQETWRDLGDLIASIPGSDEAVALINKQASWDEIKAALAKVQGAEGAVQLIDEIVEAERLKIAELPSDPALRAEALFQRGDYPQAQRELESLVRHDPKSARSWLELAKIYSWDKQWQDSLDAYTQYMKLRPEDWDAHLRYAQTILYSGDAASAADEAWMLISDPNTPLETYNEALGVYAVALCNSGQHKAAVQWFEQALRFDRHNVQLRSAYASCLAGARRFDDALAQYNEALKDDPTFDEARIGRAQVYSWKGDQKKAQKLFDEIEMTSDYYAASRIGKAYSYLWAGQRQQAVALADEASRVDPTNRDLPALVERLNNVPKPVASLTKRQSHDSEDNDYSGQTLTITVPLDPRGTQLTASHEDFKLDNTRRGQKSDGTNTTLGITVPINQKTRLLAEGSKLDIKNGADPGLNEWNWRTVFGVQLTPDWFTSVGYASSTMYDTTQLARSDIRVREYSLNTDLRLFDNDTHFLLQHSRGSLSDGNARNSLSMNLQRTARFAGAGRLNYGVAYRNLHYAQVMAHGYWSPLHYDYKEVYADWLDESAHKLRWDAGLGWGLNEVPGSKVADALRYNLGVRTYLAGDRLVLRSGIASSEAATVAAVGPGYKSRTWYLTADYQF